MKQLGLRSKYGRRKAKNVYTSENTQQYIPENLFLTLQDEDKKKEIWSMDFTEQKIRGKKVFTCGIISVNRKVVTGYLQSYSCKADLAVQTVLEAVRDYGVPYMIHTDRGSQFTSKDFHDTMEQLGIRHSMSRPHTPADNRFIETFWKTMKVEIGKTSHLTPELYRLVVDYYIHYYNYERPHSALAFRPPLLANPVI